MVPIVQKKAVEVEEDGAGMDSASDEDDKSAVRSGQHSQISYIHRLPTPPPPPSYTRSKGR